MIEYVKGIVASVTPAQVIVETSAGLGYGLNISLGTYDAVRDAKEVKLLVHEQIREDAWTLYGFATEAERLLFRDLLGVSGVGAATALLILSGLGVARLQSVIANSDVKSLKSVKGVGAKTAERIIVDLRDKIKPDDATLINNSAANSDVYDEALAALVMLGYTKPVAQKALKKIFADDPSTTSEKAIKRALSMV